MWHYLAPSIASPSSENSVLVMRSVITNPYGHVKVVQLLLNDPRVDPSDDNKYAIRCTSENGHSHNRNSVTNRTYTHLKLTKYGNGSLSLL
jgi:hypothetical protein